MVILALPKLSLVTTVVLTENIHAQLHAQTHLVTDNKYNK